MIFMSLLEDDWLVPRAPWNAFNIAPCNPPLTGA